MTRKLFITGKPGIGKTTLISKIVERMKENTIGFYTQEMREDGKRVGFQIVTTWGERFPLAHININGPKVSRYGVDVKDLENLISRLDSLREGKILIIDEIGKMELLSAKFRRWLEQILNSDQDILATIPIKSPHQLINYIRKNYPVWELTKENRDQIMYRILDFFSPYCEKAYLTNIRCNNHLLNKRTYRFY